MENIRHSPIFFAETISVPIVLQCIENKHCIGLLSYDKLWKPCKFPRLKNITIKDLMEDRKEYILKKAGELYFKFGIKSVTMDDVASELGFSKKTLYQHFKDKADLISQVIDYYIKNPQFSLNNVEHGNSIDGYFAFRSHIIYVLKYFHNTIEFDLKKLYPKLYRKVHKMKRERIFSNTVENLNDGISQGWYRSDLDVEVIAKLQVGRMLLTLNPENGIFTEREVSGIELFDKVIDYHMHAVCTEKGINYYKQQLNKIKNDVQN